MGKWLFGVISYFIFVFVCDKIEVFLFSGGIKQHHASHLCSLPWSQVLGSHGNSLALLQQFERVSKIDFIFFITHPRIFCTLTPRKNIFVLC